MNGGMRWALPLRMSPWSSGSTVPPSSGETTRIPLSRIRQLAGILKTTPEYLLGLDDRQDEIPAFDEDVIVMARVLQSVPPEKRELFSRMLQMMADDPTDTKGLKARGIPAQTED